MKIPESVNKNYSTIKVELERGTLKVPKFQREFVWKKEECAKLIDSLLKGYPIGAFIFWKTREKLCTIKNIGNISFAEIPDGESVCYVLDGQQRITSLYAILEGLVINRSATYREDFSEIYIDLDADINEEQVVTSQIDKSRENAFIKVYDVLNASLTEIMKYGEKYVKKIDSYKSQINSYPFSTITVEVNIEEATDIFTRLNVGGKPLSTFEIMCAKSYDAETNFDLQEEYRKLSNDLESCGYGTISSSTYLQIISVLARKECNKKVILSLTKEEVRNQAQSAYEAIIHVIDYIRSAFGVKVSKMMPYDAILVSLAYYFYRNHYQVTPLHKTILSDYFFRCALSERFSSSVETKIFQDIKYFDAVLEGKEVDSSISINLTKTNFLERGIFRTDSPFVRGILCLYALQNPKSFTTNAFIRLTNDWLKVTNSKNYHHFFPKSFLRKTTSFSEDYINHVINITLVDDYLNKKVIRDRSPKDYIGEFAKDNHQIAETLESHFIDFHQDYINNNDYNAFFNDRLLKIINELKTKILVLENDIFDEKKE